MRRVVICGRGLAIAVIVISIVSAISAQSLTERLSQPAEYTPVGREPLDRLIDLARHYQIPMGVEWVDETQSQGPKLGSKDQDSAAPANKGRHATVGQVVQRMVRRLSGYTVRPYFGLLLISKPDIAQSEKNLLNLKVPFYRAENTNAYEAEFRLRIAIQSTLHPPEPGEGHATMEVMDTRRARPSRQIQSISWGRI